MALSSKIKTLKRGLLTAVFAFFILTSSVSAAPAAPVLGQTDWRTGEIETCWSGVTPNNTIILYAKTYSNPSYHAVDSWTAPTESGCYISKPFENGQTVWHYIVQVDPNTGEVSPSSNEGKQTPPITAYIINWPDMFNDLKGALQDMFNNLNNHLDQLFTPSQPAIDGLKNAVNNLQDKIGAGQAISTGTDIQNSINNVQNNLYPPGIQDDGTSTFTGGPGGAKLPQGNISLTPPNGSGGTGPVGTLSAPNCDDGTDTPLTVEFPIGMKPDGTLLKCKIATQEQFDKYPWLRLVRDCASAALWILFGIWLVQRFAPSFKT